MLAKRNFEFIGISDVVTIFGILDTVYSIILELYTVN